MRNRAKCKLCGDIIESTHKHDFVTCSCGEISVDGGDQYYKANFRNIENLCFLDDKGNEIVSKCQAKKENFITVSTKPTREELLGILDEMVSRIENLPQHAALSPITHSDFSSLLRLLSSVLRSV